MSAGGLRTASLYRAREVLSRPRPKIHCSSEGWSPLAIRGHDEVRDSRPAFKTTLVSAESFLGMNACSPTSVAKSPSCRPARCRFLRSALGHEPVRQEASPVRRVAHDGLGDPWLLSPYAKFGNRLSRSFERGTFRSPHPGFASSGHRAGSSVSRCSHGWVWP